VAEQVRGGHAHAQPGLGQRGLEAGDDPLLLGRARSPRDEVVVVQADAPRAELRQPVDGVDRVERRARGLAEGVAAGIADRPQPEGEAMRW